jgi:hypothetical protein
VNGQTPVQTAGGRRVMSTGSCIALIVIGAIARFAVTAHAIPGLHGLNVHVVGVVLILAGALGLVLSLLLLGLLNPARRRETDRPEPPVVVERRVYDHPEPPVAVERHLYRDQPPQ